jgi:hypothetical protein
MATFVIQVLEPGKKNRKMYAGGGSINDQVDSRQAISRDRPAIAV